MNYQMHPIMPPFRFLLPVLGLAALAPSACLAEKFQLTNHLLTAEFDDAGLTRLNAKNNPQALEFSADSAVIKIDGKSFSVPALKLTGVRKEEESLTYTYAAEDRLLEVIYQLKPEWHFVSKQLKLTLPTDATSRIDSVTVFRAEIKTPVAEEIVANRTTGAVFLRLGDDPETSRSTAFLTLQNPFLQWENKDGKIALSYPPEIDWRAADGAFESDRVCIGLSQRSGTSFPIRNLAEWQYVQDPARAFEGQATLDLAESEAMRRCISAFALYKPEKSVRVHVPWCENDYQIDVGTPEGRTEWKRILDQCAAVGVTNTLFTPKNSVVAPSSENTDAWAWEECLWLGLGQKIRKGEWDIAEDPIPPSIQEMMDYAKSKDVKLIAYVYPTLGWKQDPEWTEWAGGKTGGYTGVDTGVRSFQDWFVDQLVAFQKRTGISGYSFDHWWIAYETTKDGLHPTSKYAQWAGCRRILEELRRRIPDVIIDGRQQYQWYGPWTWLGGTYPHPTTSDEQPGSFENFPDLHFSRVSGNRQRWATWYFHMETFNPWEFVPGYMTHQTPREDAKGQTVRDRPFRIHDWDLLGWRYSVVSSVGTAPFNHVVDLLPARDVTEVKHFKPEDQKWLRDWMDWTDTHRELLKKLRPIIGPPVLGRIDGTAAIDGDHGFVFLFNPNYRELKAEFSLDESIGLTAGEGFVLRELYPRKGRLLGKAETGVWQRGDTVSIPIKGPETRVVEVVPISKIERPALLQATGTVALDGEHLNLTEVEGEFGRKSELAVLVQAGRKVSKVTLNGRDVSSFKSEEGLVKVPVTFAGTRFDHCQQVGSYDPAFDSKTFRASFNVPQRIFEQLAARRKAWPVDYSEEELLATWLGSDRLLLFIQIADPDDQWQVGLKIDGKAVDVKKAYSAVYPLGTQRTFTGFYVDLSTIKADTPHQIEVELPDRLKPGQFQGVFFENVETQFTRELAR
jgi:hypothetical protein